MLSDSPRDKPSSPQGVPEPSASRKQLRWIDLRPEWLRPTEAPSSRLANPSGRRVAADPSDLLRAVGQVLISAANVIDGGGQAGQPAQASSAYARAMASIFAHPDVGGRTSVPVAGTSVITVVTDPPPPPITVPPVTVPPPPPVTKPPPPPPPPPCVANGASGFSPTEDPWVLAGDVINVGGARAWRDNNPGNMRSGTGSLGPDGFGPPGPFAIFPTFQDGWNAAYNLLASPSYFNLTITQAIKNWAPDSENNTQAYINNVCAWTGFSSGELLSALPDDGLSTLLNAMYRQEGNQAGTTYNSDAPNLPDWVGQLFQAPRCY